MKSKISANKYQLLVVFVATEPQYLSHLTLSITVEKCPRRCPQSRSNKILSTSVCRNRFVEFMRPIKGALNRLPRYLHSVSMYTRSWSFRERKTNKFPWQAQATGKPVLICGTDCRLYDELIRLRLESSLCCSATRLIIVIISFALFIKNATIPIVCLRSHNLSVLSLVLS